MIIKYVLLANLTNDMKKEENHIGYGKPTFKKKKKTKKVKKVCKSLKQQDL